MCGAPRASDSGKKAVLMGWVNRRRDHGNLLFLDLRDRTGVTQVVINAERDAAIHEKSAALRNEYVIAVTGTVKLRDPNTVNRNMKQNIFGDLAAPNVLGFSTLLVRPSAALLMK